MAEEEEQKHELCDHCHSIITGDDIDNMTQVDDGLVCQTCYENEYFTCEHCNNTCPNDEAATVQGRHEECWCERCRDRHAISCDSCGDYFTADYINTDDNGTSYCESCADGHIICESCNCWTSEWNDDNLCDSCAKADSNIHEYHHYYNDPIFLPNSRESIYFGVELETERYDDYKQAASNIYALSQDEKLFHLEEDCSLSYGFEIITQPCSLEFHQKQFPWSSITASVRDNGGKSEKGDAAALHIHFSKSFYEGKHNELYQLRLIYLFERFWSELVNLARTSEYLLNRSCQRYYKEELFSCPSKTKMQDLQHKYNRYMAVNLSSSQRTVEIRLFKGTLAPRIIIASIELVDFLARLAKYTSTKQLQRITWADMLKKMRNKGYLYLPAYLEERNA